MKTKIGFALVIAASVAAIPIRVWQYRYNIDLATGFYNQNDVTHYVLTAILAVALIGLLVLSIQTKNNFVQKQFPEKRNIPLGATSLLAGLATVLFAADSIVGYLSGQGQTDAAERPQMFEMLLFVLFGLAAAAGLFYIGAQMLRDGRRKPLNSALCLLPLLLAVIRLLQSYIDHINIRNISEFAFIVLMLTSGALFYLYFARILTGFATPKMYTLACFFAGASAVFSFTSAGARFGFYYLFPALSNKIPAGNIPLFIDLLTGILAAVFLGCIAFSKEKTRDTSDERMEEDGFVLMDEIAPLGTLHPADASQNWWDASSEKKGE